MVVGALAAALVILAALIAHGTASSTGDVHPGALETASSDPAPTTPPSATPSGAADEQAVARTLSAYFTAINNRDYETAWRQLTPQEQARLGTEQQFAQGDATTQVSNMVIRAMTWRSPGVEVATVTFTSTQAPANSPDGSSCDNWSLVYTVVEAESSWRIDDVAGEYGVREQPC